MKLDESLFKENYKVGDTIKIINMAGEPQYNGKSGVIDHIDSMGQLHGTWGGLAIIPEEDEIEVIQEVNESVDDRISKREYRPLSINEAINRDISEIENISKAGPIAFSDYYILNNGTMDEYLNSLNRILNELGK